MKTAIKCVVCLQTLAFTLGLAPAVEAAQHSAILQVSVTVVARAKMLADHQESHLDIGETDVTRGYVEKLSASRFSVSTNSRSGYVLEFHPVGNIVESVQVIGLGNTIQLGADGGDIVQRSFLQPPLLHDLSFRFSLRQDTKPGSYAWPLQLSVRAL